MVKPAPIREPMIIRTNGKTIEAIPCTRKHRDYFEQGYLVLSCSKCQLRRVEDE